MAANKGDASLLSSIEYEHRGRRISVDIVTNEFTCVCPWTKQPDFAGIKLSYVPDKKCIELKSLKLYLQSYRNIGIVHESAVNAIADDLINAVKPLELHLSMEFNVRGGITTTVSRGYKANKRKG